MMYIPFIPKRVKSIDVFRALTMFVMIFVNDIPSLSGIPHWLGHAEMTEDFLGFSDLVFPAFLIVMGMSIPLAIESKIQKGVEGMKIIDSILSRTFALIMMGLLLLNAGRGVSSDVPLNSNTFTLLTLLSFFLIWNTYKSITPIVETMMKGFGYVLMITLIYIYRDSNGNMFQQGWWGILGLIGWAYGICAVLYLYFRQKPVLLVLFYLFFVGLSILGTADILGPFDRIIPDNGCHQAFSMTGLLSTLFLLNKNLKKNINMRLIYLLYIAFVLLVAGYVSNMFWIISKILATPAWLFYSSGLTMIVYVFIYWLIDLKGKSSWFKIIEPAGTATLTCYLVPTLLYVLMSYAKFKYPEALCEGSLGLSRSAIFSLIAIGFTAVLGRVGIKLKI